MIIDDLNIDLMIAKAIFSLLMLGNQILAINLYIYKYIG